MNIFLKSTLLVAGMLFVALALSAPAQAYHQPDVVASAKLSTHQPYADHYEKPYVYGLNGRAHYSVEYNYQKNHYRNYPNTYRVHYTYPVRSYGAYGYYSQHRTYASGSGVYHPYYPTLYGWAVQSPVYVNTLYAGSYYSLY